MSNTRRGTRDPRAFIDQPEYFSGREIVARILNGYKIGHEDAVNQTVSLASTDAGKRAIEAMVAGDAKAYRKALARERGKVV